MVIARAGGRCERCDGIGITMHHRKKRSQGGDWIPSNIVALCGDGTRGCHGWVEANPNDAEFEGWHVRPWDDPAEVKVKYRDGELCLLDEDGGFGE